MNLPKIFFTDLDGTLLNDQKEITKKTRALLDDWTAAGHKLVLSSGRPLSSVLHVKEEMNLTYPGMYLIGYNGSEIWDCDAKKIIYRKSITMEDVDFIDSLAREHGIYCHTYEEDSIISPRQCEALSYYTGVIDMPVILSTPLSAALSKPPCKCIAVEVHDLDRLETFRQSLLPYAKGRLQILYSNPRYLEIFSCEAGKGTAISVLCQLLALPLVNTIAAGDEANDISMLQSAHIGIAMQNGTDDAKKAADITTASDNNQDGLVWPLTKILRGEYPL